MGNFVSGKTSAKRIAIIVAVCLVTPILLLVAYVLALQAIENEDLKSDCIARTSYAPAAKAWYWQSDTHKYFSTRDESVENCLATRR
jgi:hypothetical protein